MKPAILTSILDGFGFRTGREVAALPRDEAVDLGRLMIRPQRHQVRVDGREVALTPTEMAILCVLARRPGIVFSREQILHAIHPDPRRVSERAVNTRIQELRKKLGSAGPMLRAVRGVGYTLDPAAGGREQPNPGGWAGAIAAVLACLGWGRRAQASTTRLRPTAAAAATTGIIGAGVLIGGAALPLFDADLQLLHLVEVPGDASDASGLHQTLDDGRPHDRLGGFGSGIAPTGQEHRFLAIADRGPSEHITRARMRFHEFAIETQRPGGIPEFRLISTTLLTNHTGQPFTGHAADLHPDSPQGQRLDGEGIALAPDGRIYIADEYDSLIRIFNRDGILLDTLTLPGFAVTHRAAMPHDEQRLNHAGRTPNRGLCGLSFSPDGQHLWITTASPLIQDHGKDGRFIRLFRLDLTTGASTQYAYTLQRAGNRLGDLLCLDDHTLLVLENQLSENRYAGTRALFRVDLRDATPIQDLDALPAQNLPPGIHPAGKAVLIDLLDPDYGLPDEGTVTAFEGIAFGPDLPGGDRTLLLTTDNGYDPQTPTLIASFAVDPRLLTGR